MIINDFFCFLNTITESEARLRVEENRKVKINMVDIWMLAVMPPDYQTIKRENSK